MRDLYLKAAQMSPEQVDPDIQVCACVCFTRECVHVRASHASVCMCVLHTHVCAYAGLIAEILCRLVWVCCSTCQTSITKLWTVSMLH